MLSSATSTGSAVVRGHHVPAHLAGVPLPGRAHRRVLETSRRLEHGRPPQVQHWCSMYLRWHCGIDGLGQESTAWSTMPTTQYTSLAFGRRCRQAGITPSMGSVGDSFETPSQSRSSPRSRRSSSTEAAGGPTSRRAWLSLPPSKASTIHAAATQRAPISALSSSKGEPSATPSLPSRHPSTEAGQLQSCRQDSIGSSGPRVGAVCSTTKTAGISFRCKPNQDHRRRRTTLAGTMRAIMHEKPHVIVEVVRGHYCRTVCCSP